VVRIVSALRERAVDQRSMQAQPAPHDCDCAFLSKTRVKNEGWNI